MQNDIVKPPKEQQNIDTPVTPAPISTSQAEVTDKSTTPQASKEATSGPATEQTQNNEPSDQKKPEENVTGQPQKPKKKSSGLLPIVFVALLVFLALAGVAVYSQIK